MPEASSGYHAVHLKIIKGTCYCLLPEVTLQDKLFIIILAFTTTPFWGESQECSTVHIVSGEKPCLGIRLCARIMLQLGDSDSDILYVQRKRSQSKPHVILAAYPSPTCTETPYNH